MGKEITLRNKRLSSCCCNVSTVSPEATILRVDPQLPDGHTCRTLSIKSVIFWPGHADVQRERADALRPTVCDKVFKYSFSPVSLHETLLDALLLQPLMVLLHRDACSNMKLNDQMGHSISQRSSKHSEQSAKSSP